MKVLILFTSNISLFEWKRKKILNREISLYLKFNSDYKFYFLTYGDEKDLSIIPNSKINVIPIFCNKKIFKNKFFRFLYSIFFVIYNIKKFRKFDIIKSNQLLGSHLGILIKILLRKRLICRMGYDPNFFLSKQKNVFIKRTLIKFYSYLVFYFSDRIIVTTTFIKNYLIRNFFINEKKFFINPNFIDTNLFNNKHINKTTQLKNFISISRLDEQKNLLFLFNEISLSNAKLDLIGLKKKSDFYQKIKKKYLGINFLGQIDNQNIKKMFIKYDAFILLSKFEGNPKSLLEAMSCGMLVVGSNVDGINNIIDHGQNGFLIDLKTGSLSDLIKDIKDKKFNIKKIRENSRKFVIKNHSLKKIMNNEEFVYNSIKLL
jgi:glycosyltransferase involved in cell wall biosynthesis